MLEKDILTFFKYSSNQETHISSLHLRNPVNGCIYILSMFSSFLSSISCTLPYFHVLLLHPADCFHGDAFGLTDERIAKLIGFKCHKCRQRTPPFCAHLHLLGSKGKQVTLESTECKSADETCDIESLSSKRPLEQKSHLNDESGSCFTGDSHEKCPQRTLPDSCHAENGSLPFISSEQRETIDSCSEMDIVLPGEAGLLNVNVNPYQGGGSERNKLLTSNDSSLLNDNAKELNPRNDME